MTKPILVLANQAQVIIWNTEVVGQLSDGYWENSTPRDHWKPWSEATAVVVDADHPTVGRNFYAQRTAYDLAILGSATKLGGQWVYDAIMGRMKGHLKEAGIEMTDTQVRKELRAIAAAMKEWALERKELPL